MSESESEYMSSSDEEIIDIDKFNDIISIDSEELNIRNEEKRLKKASDRRYKEKKLKEARLKKPRRCTITKKKIVIYL